MKTQTTSRNVRLNCDHGRRISLGSMEDQDARTNGTIFCNVCKMSEAITGWVAQNTTAPDAYSIEESYQEGPCIECGTKTDAQTVNQPINYWLCDKCPQLEVGEDA